MKLAKSVSKWAASVAMAKLFDHTPPTISKHMNITHKILAIINFFRATKSMPSNRSSRWQWSVAKMEQKWKKTNEIVGMEASDGQPDDTYFRLVWFRQPVRCNRISRHVHANSKLSMVNLAAVHFPSIHMISCMNWKIPCKHFIIFPLNQFFFILFIMNAYACTLYWRLLRCQRYHCRHWAFCNLSIYFFSIFRDTGTRHAQRSFETYSDVDYFSFSNGSQFILKTTDKEKNHRRTPVIFIGGNRLSN